MNIKRFIDRPLMSIVINVMVVAVGIIALTRLPIEKFPDIAPPTVYLWPSYPGASAETVQKSVVAPLEQAINGVDNMMYMTSSASNGSASISIYFKQGTNADMAAVNVQNRVVQAQAQLPAEVLRMGVAVEKQQPGQLRILALESPRASDKSSGNPLSPCILRLASGRPARRISTAATFISTSTAVVSMPSNSSTNIIPTHTCQSNSTRMTDYLSLRKEDKMQEIVFRYNKAFIFSIKNYFLPHLAFWQCEDKAQPSRRTVAHGDSTTMKDYSMLDDGEAQTRTALLA